jgi:hypothetical protein
MDEKEIQEITGKLTIDRETGIELLAVLGKEYIDYKYSRVHKLIRQLYEFTEKK